MEADADFRAKVEAIARAVYFAGLEVHKHLGPGLLESAYQACLMHELSLRGLNCIAQFRLPITYKGLVVQDAYVIDILVENCFVIELKAVETIMDKHKAQLLTYLKYGNYTLGFLINFNEATFKEGLTRIANNH